MRSPRLIGGSSIRNCGVWGWHIRKVRATRATRFPAPEFSRLSDQPHGVPGGLWSGPPFGPLLSGAVDPSSARHASRLVKDRRDRVPRRPGAFAEREPRGSRSRAAFGRPPSVRPRKEPEGLSFLPPSGLPDVFPPAPWYWLPSGRPGIVSCSPSSLSPKGELERSAQSAPLGDEPALCDPNS